MLEYKSALGGAVKNENITNQELAEELHKPVIRKFEKRKVYSPFINKGIRFLLCGIDGFIYSWVIRIRMGQYAWAIPLKEKKGVTITNAFQKNLDVSNRKPSKIWVDKGSEFYNSSMKSWLQDNKIEIY